MEMTQMQQLYYNKCNDQDIITLKMLVQVHWLISHSRTSSLLSHEQRRLTFCGWKSNDITCPVCPKSLDNDLLDYNNTMMYQRSLIYVK